MLIGMVVLMIINLRVAILFSLDIHRYLRRQGNNASRLVILPRLSIKP
jgi:hypothetical protein